VTDPDPQPNAAAPAPTPDLGPPPRAEAEAEAVRSSPLVALGTLVLVLAAAVLLRMVADVLVPVLFGMFVALVAWPLVGALERRTVRHGLALAIAIAVVVAVVVVAAGIIVLSVGELVLQIPKYEDQLTTAIDALRDYLAGFGIALDPSSITSVIDFSSLAGFLRPVASAASGVGVTLFVLTFTMLYAMAGGSSLGNRARQAFGDDHPLLAGIEQFGHDLRRFLWVRALLGVFAAVLSFVLLVVLGVPLPALWAFLVFAASFIPNVGTILALIPPLILGFLDGGLVTAIVIVIGYTAINFAQDHFLQPVVMGSELNLSPLVVFLAVIGWAWILGAAGALLAVPLTVGLVALFEAFPASRPWASLMRNTIEPPPGTPGADVVTAPTD
jgi:predicted PurR-regulated permease PerM